MSKIFAVFIPIFSIIITTLFIAFSNNKPNENVNSKSYLILLIIGIFLFLGVFFFLK